jgi:integrase
VPGVGVYPRTTRARTIKRELARACARAGVPRVTPNDLRRTFATWLKQSDVDSAVVAAMMGHSSTAMVDRVYGKLDEAS